MTHILGLVILETFSKMELFLMVILEVPEFQYDVVKFKGAVWDDKIKKVVC